MQLNQLHPGDQDKQIYICYKYTSKTCIPQLQKEYIKQELPEESKSLYGHGNVIIYLWIGKTLMFLYDCKFLDQSYENCVLSYVIAIVAVHLQKSLHLETTFHLTLWTS
jgi:hypothetical protein